MSRSSHAKSELVRLGVVAFALVAFYPKTAAAQVCIPQQVPGAELQVFKDMPPGSMALAESIALGSRSADIACWSTPPLFCPSCGLTRAQLAVFMVAAGNFTLLNPAVPTFNDVPATHPNYRHIETVVARGWVGGCAAGQYCPNGLVTRGQGAVFAIVSSGSTLPTPTRAIFSDVPTTHAFFRFVEGLALKCANPGCTATTFCPGDTLTRAEAAVFFAHSFGLGNLGVCDARLPPPVDAGTDAGGRPDAGVDAAGGSSGAAGSAGSADAAAGSGGGDASAGSAGSSGSVGSSGSAGSSGGSAGSGGSSAGSGGSSAGTGGSGASGAAAGRGGSAGAGARAGSAGAAARPAEDDGGCGCRTPAGRASNVLAALSGLFALWLRRQRRQKRSLVPDSLGRRLSH